MIWLWISLGIIGFIIIPLLIVYGIILCENNNTIGVFVLFVSLNIFGLILGLCILSNNKKIDEDKYLKNYYKIKKEKKKKRKIRWKN